MNELTYFIVLGVLTIFGLALIFGGRQKEDPLASRRRYLAITVDIAAIAVVTAFRFGAVGLLFGGC